MRLATSKRIIRVCLYSALGLLLFATVGCTVIRPVSTNAVNYNRAIERTQNQTLLLNIVRASKRQPKVFSGLTRIQGIGSTGLSPSVAWGLSSQAAAEDVLTLGSSMQRGTAIAEVATLDSEEFMQGILNPVSLDQVAHFWEQGWQKVLLLTLFLERVEMTPSLVRRLQENRRLGCVDFDKYCDKDWCVFENRPSESFVLVQVFADRVGELVRHQAVDLVDDPCQTEGACVEIENVKDVQHLLDASRDHSVVFKKREGCFQASRRVRKLSIDDGCLTKRTDKGEIRAVVESAEGADDCETGKEEEVRAVVESAEGADDCETGKEEEVRAVVKSAEGADDCETGKEEEVRAIVRSVEGVIHYLGQLMRYQDLQSGKILKIDLYEAADVCCDPTPYGCRKQAAGVVFFAGESSEMPKAPAEHPDRWHLPRPLSVKHEGIRYVVPGNLEEEDLSFSTLALVSNLLGLNRARDSEPSPGTVVVGVGS